MSRKRAYWTLEAHWRPDAWCRHWWYQAGDTHLRASAGRRNRAYWTLEAHWRKSARSRNRTHRVVKLHWRPGVYSRHQLFRNFNTCFRMSKRN